MAHIFQDLALKKASVPFPLQCNDVRIKIKEEDDARQFFLFPQGSLPGYNQNDQSSNLSSMIIIAGIPLRMLLNKLRFIT